MNSDDHNVSIELDLVEQVATDLRMLKSKLPSDSVLSLAGEVLNRVLEQTSSSKLDRDKATPQQIENLTKELLSSDDRAAAQWVAEQRVEGVPVRVLYLTYLAGAAEQLGVWWSENRISLVDVTIGTSRIFAILRSLAPMIDARVPSTVKSAMFASTPEEDHTLGIRMATDLLRNDGWNIDLKVGLSHDELVAEISRSNTTLIGMSAAGQHSASNLAKLVIATRILKPEASIFVSGKIVVEARDLVELMGVDGMADGFEEAKVELLRLWQRPQKGYSALT